LANDGVVLAAEKKETSNLFIPTKESGKLYKVDEHLLVAVSGVVADANHLIEMARLHCQQHLYSMHEPIYIEELVKFICNQNHHYTQFGSSRPFGVGLMYAGYDKVEGFQLYNSDPSGNYAAWKAHASGKGCVSAISTLKDEYKKGSLKEAITLAVQVLAKSMDSNSPSVDKYEISVLKKDADGNIVQRALEGAELKVILDEAKVLEKAEGK
jgi:20S proteasome subunit alpha 3